MVARFSLFFSKWLCAFGLATAFALVTAAQAGMPEASFKGAQAGSAPQIECVTPDGHAAQVSRLPGEDPSATALIMDDDTVTCLLQEGETKFVIELPKPRLVDRLTFLNENAAAKGELRIAVSTHRLAADSPDWIEVEGIVPFSHKRLFGVSLLGIEAKFIRVSFQVEKEGRIAARATRGGGANRVSTEKEIANVANDFANSALNEALNSKYAVVLGASSESVAPLTPSER